MTEQTVAMYCFLDDLLTYTRPVWARPTGPRRRLSDAQVLTTALVAARYFGGNLVVGQRYMEQHWGQKRLDKSGFSRQLHRLSDTLAGLFATFGTLLKHLHTEARYVIDSFPVAVCHNTRIRRCKLLTGKAYHGRCASKRCWFYGFKVQVVATTNGIPVDYYIHAGSEANQTGLRALAPDLPEGSVLYTDAGYTDYVGEDLFEAATGNRQQSARRSNSQRPHEPSQAFLIQYLKVSKPASASSRPAFPSKFMPLPPRASCSKSSFSSLFTPSTKLAYSPQLELARQPGYPVTYKNKPVRHCAERVCFFTGLVGFGAERVHLFR